MIPRDRVPASAEIPVSAKVPALSYSANKEGYTNENYGKTARRIP